MQYVWQHRLWLPGDMRTVDGEYVEVLDPGLLNSDAGPDFFNAKIRIGANLWAGNVEIHVRASDWMRHGHASDPAYDTVILHVVENSDCRVTRPDGKTIPQIVMSCARDFSRSYDEMVNNPSAGLACAGEIPSLPDIYITDWITALAFERLYAKADRIDELVRRLGGNWREAIYVTLARALGFHTNSDPFERLALATPLSRLLHHQGNLDTIEGTLLGQAGLLPEIDDTNAGKRAARLAAEHKFMCAKYGFRPLQNPGWRMARMRPYNFPQRRISLLAAMIADGFQLSHRIFSVNTADEARELFRPNPGALGGNAVNILIINVVVPVIYAYGRFIGDDAMTERAVDILHGLPAEQNNVIRLFEECGIPCRDAFTSQALIELRRNYCEPRKCLYCRLGHRFLARKALRR